MDYERLRKEMLEIDGMSPSARRKHHDQIREMLYKPIKLWEHVLGFCVAVGCLVGTVVCCAAALRVDPGIDLVRRFYLMLTALLAAAGFVWIVATRRRRRFRLAQDSAFISAVVWGFITIIVVFEILTHQGTQAIVTSVVGAVMVGFPLTWERMRVSELRLHERILTIALSRLDAEQHESDETLDQLETEQDDE